MLVLWTEGADGKDRMHVGQVKLARMLELLALMGLEVALASSRKTIFLRLDLLNRGKDLSI